MLVCCLEWTPVPSLTWGPSLFNGDVSRRQLSEKRASSSCQHIGIRGCLLQIAINVFKICPMARCEYHNPEQTSAPNLNAELNQDQILQYHTLIAQDHTSSRMTTLAPTEQRLSEMTSRIWLWGEWNELSAVLTFHTLKVCVIKLVCSSSQKDQHNQIGWIMKNSGWSVFSQQTVQH